MKKTENRLQKLLPRYLLAALAAFVLLLAVLKISLRSPVQNPAIDTPASEIKSENGAIDEATAIEKVRNLPQVKEYLKDVPTARILADHIEPETDSLVIQVFEIKNGHTATFNWYTVNKTTGKVRAEFDNTDVQGE